MPLGAAAGALGVPANWLKGEAESGRLPHLRAGARFLFDVETVGKILRDRATRRRTSQAKTGVCDVR